MQQEILLRRIQDSFPGITWNNYEIITTGCDNDICILDETLVFRFPKSKYVQDKMTREIKLLNICKKHISTCSIPIPEYISPNETFWWYKSIRGSMMNKRVNDTIIKEISEFMNELHAIPIWVFGELSFEDPHYSLEPGYLRYIANEIEKECVWYLWAQEIENAQKLIMGHEWFVPTEKCFIHLDLTWNMIVDNELTRLVWVIDFSDSAIFDPAADFARFFDWDEQFAMKVLSNYHANSESFRERAYYFYKKLLLVNLPNKCKDPKRLAKTKQVLWL